MSRDNMTMCDLAEEKDIEEMRVRAKDAHWICSECGRSAHKKEHLCEPIEI
ncbi:MAG: hypothetical protein ACXADC_12085 [Candidatus Thorarchaeota archaeon]